jgi:ComF family protein
MILDMIYPARCPLCGEIVIPKGRLVCKACEDKPSLVKEPRCKKCSKPIELNEKEYCSNCERRSFHYDSGFSVWVYDDVMRQSIANFKYHNKKEYAAYYTSEILKNYGDRIRRLLPDAIVPIPVHISKYIERGYNQADILARGLGKELQIPVLSDLLLRTKKTLPQKKLNDKERLRNLMEAFQLNDKLAATYPKKLSRILLVDDIYTTGSTMEACTNVLKTNGIKEVYFIVLCIGKGY